jgi:DNA primase
MNCGQLSDIGGQPMAAFIDFQALKERVKIEQVVQMLGLRMKGNDQLRSACPACRSGGDRALAVNVSKGSYYCFADSKGGDLIALCAHVRGVSQREAAEEIAKSFGIGEPEKPAQRPSQPATEGLKPLDYLEHTHDAVQVLGFDAETAEQLGIGYAGKGLMRGTVAVPIRLEDGTLVGYLGITEAKLPPRWQIPTTNVVKLKKPA